MSGEERPPVSWEALAAELAATREEAEDHGADPATWDAVAAELAARVAERPPARPAPPADPVAEPPALPPPSAPPASGPAAEPEPGPGPGPGPEPEPDPEPDPAALLGGLEALLFVVDGPAEEAALADALRCSLPRVRAALAELAAGYDARGAGITLRRVGGGWRLYTREEHAEVVERHLVGGQRSRLTQAALETLAVIAYRQPVTRARVAAIRGVGVDGVMRTLLARGLVQEVGSDPDSGGGLYATTPLFLERLGLSGLDELPELGPLLPDPAALVDEHPDV
ncbi:SMC-Scp complex subunit ScpB [Geodermatophilus marinus]|uniref:SMC-Scp complex subunit ScpB n=1 Tax=Geodermatophilus sp. LHW52908 TaxID=2303986 RepID=UPI000E3BA3CA|nr:SMC-Scp complex subunit ScpB [Geodermatophilus sp. LHW52908]RFU19243.1 SMC-Scp complex subunit ScpB [Geodermatophilus sp. LHW52908]